MPGVPRPDDCFLESLEVLHVLDGRKVWASADRQRLYTWDSLHGEVEVFNRRGRHLGAANAQNGELVKPAVRGRSIDV